MNFRFLIQTLPISYFSFLFTSLNTPAIYPTPPWEHLSWFLLVNLFIFSSSKQCDAWDIIPLFLVHLSSTKLSAKLILTHFITSRRRSIQIKTPVPSMQFRDSQTAPKKHLGNEAVPQPHPQRFWFWCPREGPGNWCSKKHSRWFEHAPGLGTTSKADSGWRLKAFDWISSPQGCRKLMGIYEQVSVEFRAAF